MNQTTEKPTEIGQTTETNEPAAARPKRVMRPHCKHCGEVQEEHTTEHPFEPRPRGFAAMSKAQHSEIASRGGKSAHAVGKAHKWTPEEAKAAGLVGGKAPHVRRGPARGKRRNGSANHMIRNTEEVNSGKT